MAENELHSAGIVRVYGKEKCFGPGVAELLERVDETRSLRKATIEMGMAYSKAWRIVKEVEDALGISLLSSVTGGAHGGGATLTPEATDMLARYEAFTREITEFTDAAFSKYFS